VHAPDLIHVDVDADEIGRMHTPDVGMVAAPGAVMEGLLARLGAPEPPSLARREATATSNEAARANAHAALRARAVARFGGHVFHDSQSQP